MERIVTFLFDNKDNIAEEVHTLNSYMPSDFYRNKGNMALSDLSNIVNSVDEIYEVKIINDNLNFKIRNTTYKFIEYRKFMKYSEFIYICRKLGMIKPKNTNINKKKKYKLSKEALVAGTLALVIPLTGIMYSLFDKKDNVDLNIDSNSTAIETQYYDNSDDNDPLHKTEVYKMSEETTNDIEEKQETEYNEYVTEQNLNETEENTIVYEDADEEIIEENNENEFVVEISSDISVDTEKKKYVEDHFYGFIEEIANKARICPELLKAIAVQENGYNEDLGGSATGLMQIENYWEGKTVTFHNYDTNEDEDIYVTHEDLKNPEFCIKVSAAIFQDGQRTQQNNPFTSLACYNQGDYGMSKVLSYYADKISSNVSDIKKDYFDLGWIDFLSVTGQGDKNYLTNVLKYSDITKISEYYNIPLEVFNQIPGINVIKNVNQNKKLT